MIIQCEHCQSRFKIADEKVPPQGAAVNCPSCKNRFAVYPAGSAGAPAPTPAPAAPAAGEATPTVPGGVEAKEAGWLPSGVAGTENPLQDQTPTPAPMPTLPEPAAPAATTDPGAATQSAAAPSDPFSNAGLPGTAPSDPWDQGSEPATAGDDFWGAPKGETSAPAAAAAPSPAAPAVPASPAPAPAGAAPAEADDPTQVQRVPPGLPGLPPDGVPGDPFAGMQEEPAPPSPAVPGGPPDPFGGTGTNPGNAPFDPMGTGPGAPFDPMGPPPGDAAFDPAGSNPGVPGGEPFNPTGTDPGVPGGEPFNPTGTDPGLGDAAPSFGEPGAAAAPGGWPPPTPGGEAGGGTWPPPVPGNGGPPPGPPGTAWPPRPDGDPVSLELDAPDRPGPAQAPAPDAPASEAAARPAADDSRPVASDIRSAPPARPPTRAFRLLLTAFVALIAAGSYGWLTGMSFAPGDASFDRVRQVISGTSGEGPTQGLDLSSPSAWFVSTPPHREKIFVMDAVVSNHSVQARELIHVRGRLMGDGGAILAEIEVPCGNAFNEQQLLRFSSADDVTRAYTALGDGLSNKRIEPGTQISCTVVFYDAPDPLALASFELEITQAGVL